MLGPLVPGRYALRAYSESEADSPKVVANAGDEHVELRLARGGALAGAVVDAATGRPCAAHILVSRTGEPGSNTSTADARDDGAFRIHALGEGTYDLAVKASGSLFALSRALPVAASTRADLVVTLLPAASLRLAYAGRDGYLLCYIHCDGALVALEGVESGGTSIAVVPPGHLVVEGFFDGTSETRELDLATGEEQELRFAQGD